MSYQKKRSNSPCGAYQGIGLRNFLQKLLAIAPNGSVAAFFFFPPIQFMNSTTNSTSSHYKKDCSKLIFCVKYFYGFKCG